jgi:hypothetical protein
MKMDLKQNKMDDKIKGALNTPKGKGVVAGLVLIIILLLVLLVVTFAIPQPDDSAGLLVNNEVVKSLDKTPNMPVAQTTTQTASAITPNATATVEETESIKYSEEMLSFRDPFEPLIESTPTYSASSVASEGEDVSQSTSSTSNTENSSSSNSAGADNSPSKAETVDNSITLNSITTEGQNRYGVFVYQGAQYTAAVGETIGTSPYQLLEIGDGSATLLYGDDRITVSLGEEIMK